MALHLNKLESPLSKDACASLVKIGQMVLDKKSKIGKVDRQTDGQTDRRTTSDQNSSLELAAEVAKKSSKSQLQNLNHIFMMINYFV